MLDLFWADTR